MSTLHTLTAFNYGVKNYRKVDYLYVRDTKFVLTEEPDVEVLQSSQALVKPLASIDSFILYEECKFVGIITITDIGLILFEEVTETLPVKDDFDAMFESNSGISTDKFKPVKKVDKAFQERQIDVIYKIEKSKEKVKT